VLSYGCRVPEDARISALREAYERFNRGDIEGALEFLDPDVEWPDLINDRTIRGRDAVRDYWRVSLSLIVPVVTPNEFFLRDDDVVVLASQRITSLHGGQEVEVASKVVHEYTFRDGRIVKMVLLNPADSADSDPAE